MAQPYRLIVWILASNKSGYILMKIKAIRPITIFLFLSGNSMIYCPYQLLGRVDRGDVHAEIKQFNQIHVDELGSMVVTMALA